jgi:hypothetical protein
MKVVCHGNNPDRTVFWRFNIVAVKLTYSVYKTEFLLSRYLVIWDNTNKMKNIIIYNLQLKYSRYNIFRPSTVHLQRVHIHYMYKIFNVIYRGKIRI